MIRTQIPLGRYSFGHSMSSGGSPKAPRTTDDHCNCPVGPDTSYCTHCLLGLYCIAISMFRVKPGMMHQ